MKNCISEKQFFEYMNCPLKYEFNRRGLKSYSTSFNKQIYSVVKNLYLSTLDATYKSINPLKQKWDKVCIENNLVPKKALEGWGNIINVYNYITNNDIKFSDVDGCYELEIPGSKISIKGQLDPYIDKGTHIEVFISHFGKKQPDTKEIDKKLKHTIDAYVLRQLYNKDVIFKYHCFTTNNEYITRRSTKDFRRLESIVKIVGQAIENNIIYPRETFMCSSCDHVDLCKSWEG